MQVNLSPYANKKICVAVSGGKDSMALLHYLFKCGGDFGITVSALNCDHGIRGEESERDSAFVKEYCAANNIPLRFFKAEAGSFKDEKSARLWRLECYKKVLEDGGADVIATAHHLNDNAETVLFNLARGTSLAGVKGIADEPSLGIIRPFISLSREQIDGYIEVNDIPFVVDGSNLSDAYTRNKIRHNVLPALEEAVHGAARNIYNFSRLAAEDEEYFARKAEEIILCRGDGFLIKPCGERVIFKRAVHFVVARKFGKIDYTSEQFEKLFLLQSAENGKRFEFLGLIAIKEEGGVAVMRGGLLQAEEEPFSQVLKSGEYACKSVVVSCGQSADSVPEMCKALKFDLDCIPQNAVVRFRCDGDKFTKFGGGSKSLSDYLTDKKVPQSLRATLPLVCDGSDVLIVCGVEISDKVKITQNTLRPAVMVCADPFKIN
ncbi:MAG: tRNA lysidine(34) synthetase TilS [Clostridia bacterium]|nr:tRNA lysidine(34) synthetase TilS [Clostridia bacterium]